MKVLFSIIVPIYKVEINLLKECLDSVCTQSYNDYECILISDGASKEIILFLEDYIKDKSNFKLFMKENSGVSDTRNLGIEKAKGKYLTFLDADDFLEKDSLKNFDLTLKKNNNHDYYIFKNNIYKDGKYTHYNNEIEFSKKIEEKEILDLYLSTFGCKVNKFHWIESVWGNLYKKEFIIKNNILFDKKLEIGEDLMFNYTVWNKSNNAFYSNIVVYNYRINNQSVMHGNIHNLIKKYLKLNEVFENLIIQLKFEKKYYSCFYIKQLKKYFKSTNNYKELYNLVKEHNYYKFSILEIITLNLKFKDKIFLLLFKFKILYLIDFIKKK